MQTTLSAFLHKIRHFFIPFCAFIAIGLLIKLFFSRHDIFFAINSLHCTLTDYFFRFYTNMGDGLCIISISILLVLFSYRKSLLFASSYALTSIIAQVLKPRFNAPRPALYFKAELSHIYFVKGVDIFEINSFPSGHTVSAFSAALVLSYVSTKKSSQLVYFTMALLVGYSRMYLSEHFLDDVLGGAVIGTLITLFWVYWLDGRSFIQRPSWQGGLLRKKA